MKTLSHLIIAVLCTAACNQQEKGNSDKTPICEICNVSIDSGALKMYIPFSLIDTSFSMVYDTHFDEVFLIDSFYNKERTISIAVKRDAWFRSGKNRDKDIAIKISQNIFRIIRETGGGVEIFKADTIFFNQKNRGAVISYVLGDGINGFNLIVSYPNQSKWYNIDIRYKLQVGSHNTDSVYKILNSVTTKK